MIIHLLLITQLSFMNMGQSWAQSVLRLVAGRNSRIMGSGLEIGYGGEVLVNSQKFVSYMTCMLQNISYHDLYARAVSTIHQTAII